ncbi:MAG: hypothetical protein HKN43_15665 [Rhodothermales bacterium]|nr:hypothetical protein [Rhodothermales bacterium]
MVHNYFRALVVALVVLIPFVTRMSHAQDEYTTLWAEVDSLEQRGLPQTAREKALDIYDLAIASNDGSQTIKSLLFVSKYTALLEEDEANSILKTLHDNLDAIDDTSRGLLQAVIGDLYWQYFQSRRFEILERTYDPDGVLPEDIGEWDARQLIQQSLRYFSSALNNDDLLKATPTESYTVILQNSNADYRYRPTLYDLVAHWAIDLWMHQDAGIGQPQRPFSLNKPEMLGPVNQFVDIDLPSHDSLSLRYQTTRLFQDLLRFRMADNNLAAFVDADLKRLEYMRNSVTFEGADSTYSNALINLSERVGDDPMGASVAAARAIHLSRLASMYDPLDGNDAHQWDNKEALDICEETQQRWPDSRGSELCASLAASIETPQLSIESAAVIPVGDYFLARVSFSNVSEVETSIVNISRDTLDLLNRSRTEERRSILRSLAALDTAARDQFSLPDQKDYQRHSTEISIDPLPAGLYILIVSSVSGRQQTDPGFTTFQVSDIGYVSRSLDDGTVELLVSERSTGLPLADATVMIWDRTFRRAQQDFLYEQVAEYPVDNMGRTSFSVSREHRNLLSIKWNEQHLWTDQQLYSLRRSTQDDTRSHSYFFTDRAIYRPGQTVYFKGILVDSNGNDNSLAIGRESTVIFRDVNRQEIGTVNVVSNEFGSVNGSFVIPGSLLPGSVSISDNNGSVYFSVEEYKRPRFEVLLDELTRTYILGDSVQVSGSAESFFGSPVTDASVNYRVTRNAYYHPWWRHGRSIWPRSSPAEIAAGETSTDANGTFAFQFTAIPDDRLPMSTDPMFSFTVEVSVTDISGETISTSSEVLVNASGLIVAFSAPESFDLQAIPQIAIISTNPNGVPVRSIGTIRLARLRSPDYVTRDRLWAPVDTTILSSELLRARHPLDRGAPEPDKLPVEGDVTSWRFDTVDDAEVPSDYFSSVQPGIYRMTIDATDENGRTATSEVIATIFDSQSAMVPTRDVFWSAHGDDNLQVGETARVVLASALDTRVLLEVEVDGEIVSSDWHRVNNRQQTIDIPVVESYQGGFTVRLVSVQADRVFIEDYTYDVPFVDRKLSIATTSFRSNLRPGTEEEWSFRIATEDGSPADAEVMMTLFDASLDQLSPHSWSFDIMRRNHGRMRWTTGSLWATTSAYVGFTNAGFYPRQIAYPRFNWFGLSLNRRAILMRSLAGAQVEEADAVQMERSSAEAPTEDSKESKVDEPQVRRNLSELAFFHPAVRTDSLGTISVAFTMPEALTRWRLMSLAHSIDLKTGMFEAEAVTQKELMVVPNPPRYLRVGDQIELSTKITNLTDSVQIGNVVLELEDPADGNSVAELFGLARAELPFSIGEQGNVSVSWRITVPPDVEHVVYRIVASSTHYSDGEESVLAVLDNRLLVTESMPLWINGKGEKEYTFDRLQSPPSSTMETYRVSLEYASNPAWYAVQALPYLAEYPYQGAEHVFSRLYANAISRMLVRTNPRIEQIVGAWEEEYPDALQSKLMQNEDLKALAVSETPWINDAVDEGDRKRAISSLFNDENITNGLNESLLKLEQLQLGEGAWPWFAGMRPNRHVTQHIVKGLGWLRSLDALNVDGAAERFSSMTRGALEYLDYELVRDYQRLVDRSADLDDRHISSMQLHYLYARTLFPDYEFVGESNDVFDYYVRQAKVYWPEMSIYDKAMALAVLFRTGDVSESTSVRESILEYAITSDDQGMYWKLESGLRWNEAPIEIHAQVIASFIESGVRDESISEMQRWLLRNKQTHNWKSTRATTDAVYAILRSEVNMLSNEGSVQLRVGDHSIDSAIASEPGTGYVSSAWTGAEASPALANVVVRSENEGPSWGALYWQYFEKMDNVSLSGGPIEIRKELFRKSITGEGPVLTRLTVNDRLEPGDVITVKMTINADRDLEYVHLKDMRAAGTEPMSAISGYRWKSGLGFYEAISDASVSYFFDYLPRGTRVIEYDLRVNLSGDFAVGPARLQSMYAPEFVAYSAGARVTVDSMSRQ